MMNHREAVEHALERSQNEDPKVDEWRERTVPDLRISINNFIMENGHPHLTLDEADEIAVILYYLLIKEPYGGLTGKEAAAKLLTDLSKGEE